MFEKEAESKAIETCPSKLDMPTYVQGFVNGAEFGYNKTNEWHYVKDELPQYNEYVLIYTDLKNTYVARVPTEKNYFITRRGGYVQMSAVIAWKEMVLPKESE